MLDRKSQTRVQILIILMLFTCCLIKKKKNWCRKRKRTAKVKPFVNENNLKNEKIFWTKQELKICVTGTPTKQVLSEITGSNTANSPSGNTELNSTPAISNITLV